MQKSPPRYSAREFFETTAYSMASGSGYAFSADSSTLLVSSDVSGVLNAYAMPANGDVPEQLTSSEVDAVFGLSWFPSDGRILYSKDNAGDELNHVFVREIDGTSRDLTPGERLKARFIRWSKDGTSFWLATNERDARAFDLYRYSATDYERELVYENPGFELADVSPNGRWIALNRPHSSADSDIYIVDRRVEGDPRLITPHEGSVAYRTQGFAADSSFLAFSTDEHGEFAQVWAYDLAEASLSLLEEADWDVRFVGFSWSGRYRVAGVNADARTRITIRDLKSGQDVNIADLPDGDLNSVRFSGDETKIAFLLSGDTSPANVHVLDLGSGKQQRLTSALGASIEESQLVEGQVVRYKSFDAMEIPAILYRPHGATKDAPVPGLVMVHGGPGGQSRKGYRAVVQHLVNHGYAILAANNRGSSGYGKTFFHLDDRRHGDVDLKDIVHGRSYLESLPWIDASRIGIIGASYGGYMVAAALAFEPDVFDVGVDVCGVTNWERTLQNIPPWWEARRRALYDEMGDPTTDRERHRRMSPLFHADKIRKPLLVVQGANDPRVLKVESDELVAAVRQSGVPVEYLVFPDEGHRFLKKENRIAASDAHVSFLDKYLRGDGAKGL